jgi:hypothetical protein
MIGKMKNPNNMSVFQVQTVAKGRVGGITKAPTTAQAKAGGRVGGSSKAPYKAMPC